MKSNRSHSVISVLSTTNNYLLAAISLFLLTTSIAASIILYQSHKTVCELFNSKMESSGSSIARELALGETEVAKALFNKVVLSFKRVSTDVNLVLENKPIEAVSLGCEPRILGAKISYSVTFSGERVGEIHGEVKSFSLNKILKFASFITIFFFIILKFIKNMLINNIRKNIVSPIELLCGQEEIALDNLPEEVKTIAVKLSKLRESISISEKAKVELIQAEIISKVATQVAHDIRSPLEMLKGLKSEINDLPELSRKRIQLSINRIEEITFYLLKNHKLNFVQMEGSKSEELLGLLEGVVTEKNIEFRNNERIEIEEEFDYRSYALFSKIDRGSLKSILSNLINNSIESFQGNNGKIGINLTSVGEFNLIILQDNGPGIGSPVKERLFTKGFTTKHNGNGLGLYNAKQDIEAVGGTIVCESEIDKGTTFTIKLPKSEMPKSFIGSIDAFKYERIIVLDDDPAFHEVWTKRLEGLESKVEHIHSVEEMFSKYKVLSPKILLLSDFELMDEHLDGIDTILKLNHAEHSVLVTARNEEQEIQDRCIAGGIKLLPKSLINYVKINSGLSEFSQAQLQTVSIEGKDSGGSGLVSPIILVDDDKFVHLNWKLYCQRSGLDFYGFMSIADFLAVSSTLDKSSRIYIDSNLGDGIKGEIESEKIFALGFLNLYLATGYEEESIQKPDWIKKVFSKSPENIESNS